MGFIPFQDAVGFVWGGAQGGGEVRRITRRARCSAWRKSACYEKQDDVDRTPQRAGDAAMVPRNVPQL